MRRCTGLDGLASIRLTGRTTLKAREVLLVNQDGYRLRSTHPTGSRLCSPAPSDGEEGLEYEGDHATEQDPEHPLDDLQF